MLRTTYGSGIAGLGLLSLFTLAAAQADARDIQLGDVRITAAGQRDGRATVTPWSGIWWPMATGELAIGWNGTGPDFIYDPATKTYRRAPGNKTNNDVAPLLKYDAWRKSVTGVDPGSALFELTDPSLSHHVYGDEKERLDREGIGYGWWGHCNGWCAAALLEREPIAPVEAGGTRFEVADLKGLLTENHFSTESDFTGRRYNLPPAAKRESREPGKLLLAALNGNQPKPVAEYIAWYEKAYSTTMSAAAKAAAKAADFKDELEAFERDFADRYDAAFADLPPEVFHKILESVIGQRKLAFVADITANEEVWNHPAFAYESTITFGRTFVENALTRTEWTARTVVHYATDGVSESVLGVEEFTRTYTYTLVTDQDGKLLRGAWTGASVNDHPDFAWLPLRNPTTADSGENKKLVWGDVASLLPAVHGAQDARPFDLVANGTAASSRKTSGHSTTWAQPIASATGAVSLSVTLAPNRALSRVAYFEQATTGGTHPEATRAALAPLGEGTTGPGFGVSATLARGKHMLLAYGYDAAGKLVGVEEITVEVNGNVPPPPVTDDAFEQNDTAATAAVLAPGAYPNLMCADEDFYAVTLAANATLDVQLAFRHAEGDLDLQVDGPAGRVGASEGSTDAERVQKTGLAAGVYKVRVFGYSGARAKYSLTVAATGGVTPPPPAQDDRFEPNDTAAAAAVLAAGSYPGLSCKNDDWFSVTLAAEATISVKLDFRNAEGDLDLVLQDGPGTQLAKSDSSADGELVKKERLAPGTYRFRVYGYNGARAAYGLTLEVTASSGPAPTTRTGTITATTLNVRRGPATTFAIATTRANGQVVTILEERSGWYRITWTGAPTGELWASKTYVRLNQ